MKIWKWLTRGRNVFVLLFVVLPIAISFVQGLATAIKEECLVNKWDMLVNEQQLILDQIDDGLLILDKSTTLTEYAARLGELESALRPYLAHLDKIELFLDEHGERIFSISDLIENKQIAREEREATLEVLLLFDQPPVETGGKE